MCLVLAAEEGREQMMSLGEQELCVCACGETVTNARETLFIRVYECCVS